MWTEINGYTYRIVIGDGVIDGLAEGIYSMQLLYVGSGDDLGLNLYSINDTGKYIISDQIGDKLKFDSTIPQLSNSNGDYIVDQSKAPYQNSTVYVNNSNSTLFCGISDLKLVHYGKYLIASNGALEIQYNDRSGNLKSYKRYIEANDFNNVDISGSANNNTNFLVKSSDPLNQSQIEANARTAFSNKNYSYRFYPAGDWSGYVSDNLTGEYEGFGDKTDSKKVGYLNYKDTSDNEYTKGFEITKNNNVWSVVYIENGLTYISNSEPSDSNIVFNNSEATPSSITLSFDDYIQRDELKKVVSVGVDVV